MSENPKITVACLQMTSSDDVDANLEQIESQLSSGPPIDLLALPENFAQMPKCRAEQYIEREGLSDDGAKVQRFLLDITRRFNVYIVAGSLPILAGSNDKPYTRCLIVGPNGFIGHYDKLHLFDVDDAGGQRYRESETYRQGEIGVEPIPTHSFEIASKAVCLGASICYDLRFPELYRQFAAQAANIMTVSSAFTYDTGKAHWETLLRARAIENQAFVIAPAQVGLHTNGRRTWGHSMIIDPWGRILANKEESTGLLYADLDLNQIKQLKKTFPVHQHKRLERS